MDGSAIRAEILRPLLHPRLRQEKRKEYLLFGLLHKHLSSLRSLPSIPQASSDSSLRLSWGCPIGGPREAHGLLKYSGLIFKQLLITNVNFLLEFHMNSKFNSDLISCIFAQAYTINAAKVLFIKKRPQNRQFKGSGNYCTSCDRSLQEPFIHCSLGCKVCNNFFFLVLLQ